MHSSLSLFMKVLRFSSPVMAADLLFQGSWWVHEVAVTKAHHIFSAASSTCNAMPGFHHFQALYRAYHSFSALVLYVAILGRFSQAVVFCQLSSSSRGVIDSCPGTGWRSSPQRMCCGAQRATALCARAAQRASCRRSWRSCWAPASAPRPTSRPPPTPSWRLSSTGASSPWRCTTPCCPLLLCYFLHQTEMHWHAMPASAARWTKEVATNPFMKAVLDGRQLALKVHHSLLPPPPVLLLASNRDALTCHARIPRQDESISRQHSLHKGYSQQATGEGVWLLAVPYCTRIS